MKTLYTNGLFAVAVMTALFFSSCSKQITALNAPDKMIHSNLLAPTRNHAFSALSVIQAREPEAINSEIPVDKNEAPVLKTKAPSHATAALKIIKRKVLLVSDFVKKEIKTQSAGISQLSAHHATASVSGSSGFGVVAAVCAVGAICMAIFGVTQMGAIFWYLSVILIVTAIIFFLVFLTAKAVTPAPKITTESLPGSKKTSAEK